MYKIGVDIVHIPRVEKSLERETFIKKVFTQNEIAYCKRAESFAGIFAAKEAYFKAVGTGMQFPITDVEVLHDENRKPYLNSVENSDLSISHDGEYAIATVILW